MKLRNLFLFAAIIITLSSFQSVGVRAGGDMSSADPDGYYGAKRYETPRQHYRAPYGADYGPAHGRTYIFGSYYRPYRMHYYSYALPNYYTRYYPRRRRTRWYNHAPRYRPSYSSYSYRYR